MSATPSSSTPLVYELLWWAFTLVLAGLILLPVYSQLPDFPYLWPNFVYVLVAITLTRYLFFLRISWLRDRLLVQAGIGILLLPLIFWMVQYLNDFITFFDENGPDVLVKNLERDLGKVMQRYLQAEYRFFAIWAIVAALLTPLRLLFNVWSRYRAGVRNW